MFTDLISRAYEMPVVAAVRRLASGEAVTVAAPANVVVQVLDLFSQFAIIGGGLWAVWGAVTLAGGLKDQNGPQTQSGVWQVVGGGLIIAAAALFKNFAL